LGAILDAIEAQLPADVVYRVGGIDEIARTDPARRVLMEPASRSYEASHGASRALFTRVETVRMHIWCKTIDEVEELEELLVNAIIKSVAWAVRPGTGSWRLRAVSERGFVAIQEMSFLIPILRREGRAVLPPDGAITEVIDSL
jgi:hypothetical protein